MGHRLGYPGHAPYQAATCADTSEYLGNLCVDTTGFWPSMLKQLVEVFGPARVPFGTDYPAVPIGPAEHVGLVESLERSREAADAILSRNAMDLFKIGRR